jgi:predicted DNA-binding ribbon-helix-helix protein
VTLQELRQQQEEQRRAAQQEQEQQQDNEVQGEQQAQQAVTDVAAIEALTQAEPPGAGASVLCQALGPFLATEQLEEVAERLGKLGLETSRRSTETRLENGWWVYLPAMPRAEAMKIAQLLDDKNDREYYIGRDNLISLGAFRVLTRAERRMQSARKHGLDPVLEARYKTQNTHWLDLRMTGALREELAWIAEDYPDLQLEQQACR